MSGFLISVIRPNFAEGAAISSGLISLRGVSFCKNHLDNKILLLLIKKGFDSHKIF
jgi:hypothetical protein